MCFYEPMQTGYFGYPDDRKQDAINEAKDWAGAEDLFYLDPEASKMED
jgi:hypothetical protein